MSAGLGTAIISVVVFIAIIAVITGVIPYYYNKNLEAKRTTGDYCASLAKDIRLDKNDPQKKDIVITEMQNYRLSCSGGL
jgi:hypothetical protein